MTLDADGREAPTRPRRPGQLVLLAIAVPLLVGGGSAVAVGIAGQDPDPVAPSGMAEAGRPESSPRSAPATSSEASRTSVSAAPEPAPRPVAVVIPAIEVRSDLITTGLNPDGSLEVPQPGPDYDKAAWFRGSPRPGDDGPAVIEGHVDSAANGPSVFYELGRMATGDRVRIDRGDGSTAVFEVYDVARYPKDDFPTLEVYGNTDGPELRLITCGGEFDSSVRSYEDNVVVYAAMVEIRPA